mgnify:FL=1|jgi:UDP-N-acetyl-D-mannosaminuronic acid dehydrogenase
MTDFEKIIQAIKSKNISICVLGLGRVGLPLATVLVNSGFSVVGIDINKKILESIKKSQSPFYDPPLQKSLDSAISSKKFTVICNTNELEDEIGAIIVTVGTPTTKENNVDYSQLFGALEEIAKIDINEKIIIMRSTLPPNTTKEIIIPFLENKTGLKCGKDFALAVCPERILEGRAIEEIYELPEIIGGINKISNKIASEIFLTINPKKEILFTSISGAELAKLFTNVYRYISFALANEFAIWAEMYGLDASEIIKISNHNYPRSNIPIPGFTGGPCLSKDGIFLDSNTTFSSIVSTAWKLNESIPNHVIGSIKNSEGNLFNKKISVFGMSFKGGSDDIRNSPSLKLIEILRSTGVNVKVFDPHVKNTDSLEEVLDKPDIVILATNHKEFLELTKEITESGTKLVYDVWGMCKEEEFPNVKYLKLGKHNEN